MGLQSRKPAECGGLGRWDLLILLIAGIPRATSADGTLHFDQPLPGPIPESPRRTDLAWMTMGFMLVPFPVVLAHRHDEDWMDKGHHFEDGFTRAPTWYKDDPMYDYVLHPLAGAEYYLAARNRGWTLWGSLAYSVAISTFYEYVPENLIQQPSATDLLITPLGGALLGEARYWLKERIRRDPSAVPAARFWITLLDPLDLSIGGYPDGRARLYFNWKHAF